MEEFDDCELDAIALTAIAMTGLALQSPPMSLEQLKAFLEMVKGDTSLQEKLKGAKSPEHVVAIAKDHGHAFSIDKFTELSDEELDGVTGGGIHMCCQTTHNNTHG